jgi:hypothetical protein
MSIYQQSTIEIIHQEIVPFSAEVDDPQRVVNIFLFHVNFSLDNTQKFYILHLYSFPISIINNGLCSFTVS